MKFNTNVLITLSVLVLFAFSFAVAEDITLKSAPYKVVNKKYEPPDAALVDFLTEGFETWFPVGWEQIITNSGYTWFQSSYSPQEGIYNAEIVYDPALVPQDEWMISPVIDLTSANPGLELTFWFLTSYYWHVDPYDNADMIIMVSTDGGDHWSEPLWTEDDYGIFENWTWYEVTLDFDAYIGESNFKVAFVYQGSDGAQADFDAIILTDGDAPLDHDVAAVEIIAPVGAGDAGAPVTPEATFGNFGANTETFTVNMTISLDGSEVYNEDSEITDLAGNGATEDVAFPEFTPVAEGSYDITATAELTGDQNEANNSIDANYNTQPIAGFFVDFESDNGGFTLINDWQHGAPTTGPGSAWSGDNVVGTLISGQYTEGPLLSELTSPEIAIGDEPVLTFYHWYTTENTYDGGNVKISTDGGSTWALITPEDGYDGELSSSFENPIGGEQAFFGDHGSWQMETIDLSAYADQTVRVKFDYGSDSSVITGDGWYIDDFHIEFYTTGINDYSTLPNTFKLEQNYPNPFNARTEINFTMPNASDVDLSVYNMLGQKIATLVSDRMEAGHHSVNWDASQVSSGVYFYKLTAGNNSETRALTLIK